MSYTRGPWRELTEPPPADEDPAAFSRTLGTTDEDVVDVASVSEDNFRLIVAAPRMAELLERMDAAWVAPDGPFLLAISAVHKDSQLLLSQIKGDK